MPTLLGVLSLTALLMGCGLIDPPMKVGGCTLQVEQRDENGVLHVLTPPYVVPWSKDKGVLLVMRGQSWAHVHVTQADAAGTVRRDEFVPGAEMATGQRGWSLDVEGPWRFRLVDDVNGCVAEFTVDARPIG